MGPREIIPGARKPTVESPSQAQGDGTGQPHFDKVDFRKNLDRMARSNLRQIRAARLQEAEAENKPRFGLAITNKQIEKNPLELAKAESNLYGRDHFKVTAPRLKRVRHMSAAVRASTISSEPAHLPEPSRNDFLDARGTEES